MKLRIILALILVAALATVLIVKVSHPDKEETSTPMTALQPPAEEPVVQAEIEQPGVALLGTRRAPTPTDEAAKPDLNDVGLEQASIIVREILNPATEAWARQKGARSLGSGLSEVNQRAVIRFLQIRAAEDDAQLGHVLKNDLMDALIAQNAILPDLAEVFAGIYRDENQHEVIRDYAIQHLSLLAERFEEPTGLEIAAVQSQRALIQEVLWQAAEASQSSIAGTAMLGLARLAERDPAIDVNRLSATALRIASDEFSQTAARITALQLCGKLQVKSSLPLLTAVAANGTGIMLRISAIGALGYAGGRPELEWLTTLDAQSDPRLRTAVNGAIKRLAQN